jgi:phage protein D
MTVDQARSVAAGNDFYVPAFKVQIRNRVLPPDVIRDVMQVTYKDSIEEIDSFELTVNNWDAAKRAFKYSDGDLFLPGRDLELWMGYYGNPPLRLMLTGKIKSLRPTFPASGQSTLAVSGLNVLDQYRTKQESHSYPQMTDSEIAQQIAKRLGTTVRIDPASAAKEPRYDYLLQKNEYDIVFLLLRARAEGYDLFVEEVAQGGRAGESRLFFGPSVNVGKASFRLRYGASLTEFQPNLDTSHQVGKVTVHAWDQERKQKITHTATRSQLTTHGVGDRGGQPAIEQSFQDREEVVAHGRVVSDQEARRLAAEQFEQIAKQFLTGSGSIVGLPDLRAGSVLQIDGLGDRFSGRYFVTATTHTIGDSGYTTAFDCRREELKS